MGKSEEDGGRWETGGEKREYKFYALKKNAEPLKNIKGLLEFCHLELA